ncbi:hypothetical protein [Flavicella sp.]|uniref:hypothetical protein n=1 Tax=Flavicella sp. TaxID=2957742 RepID=UPI0026318AB5|nr:hypothetical protein [Flavicella sp.]MDG1804609.1 hypothetical protein [Flavicella sp.]MDG2280483.1 hypothetical protein [Flavicella sp.]
MNQNLTKILKGLVGLIALVAAYFFIKIISTGDDAIVEGGGSLGIVGPMVSFSIGLFLVVLGMTVLFSIVGLFKKPEALKKTALGLVVLGVFLAAAYGLAPDTAVTDVTGEVLPGGEAGSNSKWVSTGIWYTVLLGATAVATIVIGGAKSIFK